MTHTVLIVTDDTDLVADRVAAELAGRGTPVVTLDTSHFPATISMATGIATGSHRWAGTIGGPGGKVVDLACVGAVYWRRPTQFEMDHRMTSPERAFAYGEARRGFGGVLIALGENDCLWVNDPVAAARCEYKPVQLQVAAPGGAERTNHVNHVRPAGRLQLGERIGQAHHLQAVERYLAR
ncbi:MvdC/MvdD family ATP grasp protein [Nonomuraea sp. 10N515B]|uniref:MvdC/MvdD family ATP grasp protein n=1 Tax=Nonomuraea sp. 10N515B TaxID=3457422 RepID=UPI003FCEB5DE